MSFVNFVKAYMCATGWWIVRFMDNVPSCVYMVVPVKLSAVALATMSATVSTKQDYVSDMSMTASIIRL